jgi:type I restriction enzyme R subunit
VSEAKAIRYDPIAVSSESTVVSEYVPDKQNASSYQSEAQLETEFIRLLESQAYEYLPITSEADLIANLRRQLETLNNVTFSEGEWEQFFSSQLASSNEGIAEKTRRIQEDHIQLLRRDDGSTKNIALLDKSNIHNNRVQVINQYEVAEGNGGATRTNRYDVTVLVNGLPMVHIELKRRGVDLREAFNQINRYQRDSFWAGSGLFEYVQLFVISNGTLTKYYSNTIRKQRLEESKKRSAKSKTSNSFEFTSWWADAHNKPIQDLTAFAKTFFAKHSLLNVLTKYCVLTTEGMLLVMRPYQIVATERILQRIAISTNYKTLGTIDAGGYVWHTTGSGKTLTSFKTAQLATRIPSVDKVLFVVDRKDLDFQTMREYDRFEKGAANSNQSTAELKKQLENPSARIVVTTIQKLSKFVERHESHAVYNDHTVIIFDECHRSQFGDMHQAITKAFKRYNLFGFTGTPIFASNASTGGKPQLKTTEQAFGDKLHTYTIVDAITDKNVLPFRIDYVNTVKMTPGLTEQQVSAIDAERALLDSERIRQIVAYIREHFDQKTKRSEHYTTAGKRMQGFNSLFATASIDAAKAYYMEFKRQQESVPASERLKVGIIYSYAANEELVDGLLDEEEFETDGLSMDARSFLDACISDYNEMFEVSYDSASEGFQNYYKDLTRRLRERDLDLVIVVNMFLTGFDATTLNTLWVDKNLRSHGLIQAYSRTNRILNSVKTYGNIVSFRDLEQATNDAIALFGNKDAKGVVLLRPYQDYFSEYLERLNELKTQFPPGEHIVGEQAEREFVELWGAITRLRNILTSFDDFQDHDVLEERQEQDYRARYLDIYNERRKLLDAERATINDDLVFEIELIKQVEINVDYILMLVQQHRDRFGDGSDTEIKESIARSIDASPSLRNKKDLIEAFIESVNTAEEVDQQWAEFISKRREEELEHIIAAENLKPQATKAFVMAALRDGAVATSGTAITGILPPVSRFSPDGGHGETKQRVIERLSAFVARFFGLG